MNICKVNAFTDNYIWIIIDDEHRTCHCIDPGDANPVFDFLEKKQLTLSNILLTHHHFDHQGGVGDLLDCYPDAQVYGPNDPRMPAVNHPLSAEDVLRISNARFTILSIPGHTSTHIAYYEPSQKILFCGDTLFSAGCGRIFDSSAEQLFHSLQQLARLPEETKVYCAHEYTENNLRFASSIESENSQIQKMLNDLKGTNDCSLPSTIGLEKQINPFLRTTEPTITQYAVQQGASPTPLSVFKCIREQKDRF